MERGEGGGESLAMFTVNSSGKKKLSQQLIFVKKQNLLAGKGRSLNLEARSPTTRIKKSEIWVRDWALSPKNLPPGEQSF